MKDFNLFDIADFVMDEDFIRWVTLKDKADDIYWENWLKRNPNKHLIVAEARRILETIHAEQHVISTAVIDQEIEKLLLAINLQAEPVAEPGNVRRLSPKWKYFAAAILLVGFFGASTWLFTRRAKTPVKFAYADITAARELIENVNTSKNTITVTLPDGSTVKLASNSRISYENNFDSMATRDVFLSGQAFFNVKKKPDRPFRVFANEIVTKVLGTSFTIRSFEKDTTIQVTVSSGKVSVYSQGQTTIKESSTPNKLSGIIVTPNQQLVYKKSSQDFQKILLENPIMITAATAGMSMTYEDAPIDKVFDDLERDYGINIVYDNELLKKCTISARDLTRESFYGKLDLICRAMGAKYEVIDAQVVIQSKGCE